MFGPVTAIELTDVTHLDRELTENGRLKLFPAAKFLSLKPNEFKLWCHLRARYGIPTQELIDWLKVRIAGRDAIEIGAGNGDLGLHLGIPSTDSYYQQKHPFNVSMLAMAKQVGTNPTQDIVELEAMDAIRKYKPKVVIASWVTQYSDIPGEGSVLGIEEEKILDSVETYIHIGNTLVHWSKRILQRKHEVFQFPWVVSRTSNQVTNVIHVWNK